MAVKELEIVLSDEPGLLGPKAREGDAGMGLVASGKRFTVGSVLAFMRVYILKFIMTCFYVNLLILYSQTFNVF